MPGYEEWLYYQQRIYYRRAGNKTFSGGEHNPQEDVENAVQHEDWAVKDAHFNFDVHNLTGAGLDATGCQAKFTQKKGYTIPYGCLVPKKVEGLLLGRRDICGTHMAHSSYRVMPICVKLGEAPEMLRQSVPERESAPDRCLLRNSSRCLQIGRFTYTFSGIPLERFHSSSEKPEKNNWNWKTLFSWISR